MSDRHSGQGFTDAEGVEALLASAGGYVGLSDDLRPRVLEAVKQHKKQTLRRRRVSGVAGVLLIVTLFAGLHSATLGSRLAENSTSERVAQLVESDSATPYRAGLDELCWRLVDAVVAVRSEQAAALGPKQTPSSDRDSALSTETTAQNAAAPASY